MFLAPRRSLIPFDMFDVARSAEEARRADKLASLYHRGQDLAWNGRETLRDLLAKHGGIKLAGAEREAVKHIFAIIMWGELAAWKISVQLADELVPLEAKMAATSQAHDEARHFYVMHDYLERLGAVPRSIDRASRAVLELVLETPSLVKKLLGMQLMVESLALTIFQVVRESRVEPVLSDLLRYYEKDEARHVGLGTQLLPQLIKGLGRVEAAGLFAFQLRVLGWTLAGLKSMEPHLRVLGIKPMTILRLGRAKQTLAFQTMWEQLGVTEPPRSRQVIFRAINGVATALFSEDEGQVAGRGAVAWARRFANGWSASLDADLPATSLSPDDAPRAVRIST